jgi:hypothetical protein
MSHDEKLLVRSSQAWELSHPDLRENPNARIHVRQDPVTHMHRLSVPKHGVNHKESIKHLLHDRMSQLTTVQVANSGKRDTRICPPQAADWRTNA